MSPRRELVVLSLCCLASLTLMLLPVPTRMVVADRLGRVLTAPYWGARNFLDDMVSLRRNNVRLERELFQAELDRSGAELERLDQRRGAGSALETGFGGRLAPCRVTLRQRGRFPSMVRIKGEPASDWRPWLPVVNRQGFLGRIRTVVGPGVAWVELMSATDFALGVEFRRTGLLGVLEPREDRFMVGMVGRDEDVQVGDEIFTSGITEIRAGMVGLADAASSPRGIPVGVVSRVEVPNDQVFKRIWVTPVATCTRNETVFVVLPPGTDQESR